MPKYYIWLLIIVGTLLWLISLVVVRQWTKRKILAKFDPETLEGNDLRLPFNDPRPEDKEATEVVRAFRRRYVLKLWPDTEISLKNVMGLALELVQQIAAVYYPDDERPELHASLSELVSLQNRISIRLQALLETLPLKTVKDVDLETILYCHNVYKKFTRHPTYLFMKRHHLDKVARYAFILKNIASPWYWGYRAAYYGGKEMISRFFLGRMSTIVGVEAIRLYSGRSPGAQQWRKYELAIQEMIFMAAADGGSEAEAQRFLCRLILKSRELPETAKLALIDRITRIQADSPAEFNDLNASEKAQVQRWLKHFIVKLIPPEAQKPRLQELKQRLVKLPENSRKCS
jgi:hypothetical protein